MAGGTVDVTSLTDVERTLVDHVERGERLDLASGERVDEVAMRSWDESRTVRAAELRDILLGRLAPNPDPYGLQLRGARIAGRVEHVEVLHRQTINAVSAARTGKLQDKIIEKMAPAPSDLNDALRSCQPAEDVRIGGGEGGRSRPVGDLHRYFCDLDHDERR